MFLQVLNPFCGLASLRATLLPITLYIFELSNRHAGKQHAGRTKKYHHPKRKSIRRVQIQWWQWNNRAELARVQSISRRTQHSHSFRLQLFYSFPLLCLFALALLRLCASISSLYSPFTALSCRSSFLSPPLLSVRASIASMFFPCLCARNNKHSAQTAHRLTEQ